jgi:hypothetical protein
VAVVIAREEYEKYLRRRQAEAQSGLEKLLNKTHSRIDQSISDEDLEKEIDEASHEMRGVKRSGLFRTSTFLSVWRSKKMDTLRKYSKGMSFCTVLMRVSWHF